MWRRTTLIIVTLGLVLVLGAAGWAFWSAEQARNMASPVRAKAQGRPVPVRTEAVTTRTSDDAIGATAVVTPSQVASVSEAFSRDPANEGLIVKRVNVFEGKRVARGDLLFLIEGDRFEQVLAAAEAKLTAAKLTLELAEERMTLNEEVRELEAETARETVAYRNQDAERLELDFGRLEKINKKGGLVATIELTEAFSLLAEARFRRTEADSALKLLQARSTLGPLQDRQGLIAARRDVEDALREVEIAQRDVANTQILSPIHGFAGPVSVVAGQMLDLNTELTRIYALDPIFVRASIPIDRAATVEIDQQAHVDVDGLPGHRFTGSVVHISALVDETTKAVPVVVELPNPKFRLKPGATGFASILSTRSALVVPAVAVLRRGGDALVFVVRDGIVRITRVTLGARVDTGSIEVLDGLADGDEIVVYGIEHLEDGEAVDTDWRRWSRRNPGADAQ